MSLEALLKKLENRTVTPVTSAINAPVTAKPLQNKACTPVTLVTAENPLSEAEIKNLVEWKNYYHALVTRYDKQGSNHRDSQWQAINETLLACCEAYNMAFDSDKGNAIMLALIQITECNKGFI